MLGVMHCTVQRNTIHIVFSVQLCQWADLCAKYLQQFQIQKSIHLVIIFFCGIYNLPSFLEFFSFPECHFSVSLPITILFILPFPFNFEVILQLGKVKQAVRKREVDVVSENLTLKYIQTISNRNHFIHFPLEQKQMLALQGMASRICFATIRLDRVVIPGGAHSQSLHALLF